MKSKYSSSILILCIALFFGEMLVFGSQPCQKTTENHSVTINSAAYDASNSQTLSAGQIYYVSYNPLTYGTTVYMWCQTASSSQGLDVFVCDEYNYNEYAAGRSASVYCLHNDVHLSLDHFTSPSTTKWYFVWSNRDSILSVSFDYFLDTNGDDYPYYSGHYWDQNGITIEPGQWYHSYASFSTADTFSGYFKSYISSDPMDFFICDDANYTIWSSGGSALVYQSKSNYISSTWGPFNIPYAGTWHFVYSAKNAPDTVTFSAYMTKTTRSITISTPSSSSSWERGTSHYIYWSSSGTSGYVDIFLYSSGSSVGVIATDVYDDGSYYWTIPSSQAPGDYYQIKIYDANDYSLYDYSTPYFSIEAPSAYITITSPSSSSSWQAGNSYYIYWSSSGSSEYVDIYLYSSGGNVGVIATNVYNDGSYYWAIPSSQAPGDYYQIKIYDAGNYSLYDVSDAYYSITRPQRIPGFTWILAVVGLIMSLVILVGIYRKSGNWNAYFNKNRNF